MTRLVVDRALDRLAWRCWPDGCPRGRTCCVGLVVEASRREVRAIDGLMDELARLLPRLRDGDGFANVFVEDPPGYLIDADDDGACPFLLRTRRHAQCAIHRVALQTGRSLASVKPAACRHWPLMLDVRGGRVRLTVQPTAQGIGCVAPREALPGHPSLREAFAAEIAELCRSNGLAAPRPASSA
jgi:Fe-S-cluster containining protein